MLDKFGGMMDKMKMIQRLTKDENFMALMSNPKVRAVFMDPEFQKLAGDNDPVKMMSHPKFAELMKDPDIMKLMMKFKSGFSG